MIQPVRIQRTRQSKQVSSNGLPILYVGRPGKWGNPFKAIGDMIYGDASHRRKIFDPWIFIETTPLTGEPLRERIIFLYREWLAGRDTNFLRPAPTQQEITTALKGKNLSCWCRLGETCHADVLLEIANKKDDNTTFL